MFVQNALYPARFRDPKRYLWLLGLVVPALVVTSWLLVLATGLGVFWWTGPILTFIIIPILDHAAGEDSDNPPDSALAYLERDRFYRWATYLFLPIQYLSLVLACWLWNGGGWVEMNVIDKIGLMVTVGGIGGIAISTAHELGHKRARLEQRLSKIALAQTCYGHFFVAHNRVHHVRVATPLDPASSRLGESLWAFIPRSAIGSLRLAWQVERRRLTRLRQPVWSTKNNILTAWSLSVVLFAALVAMFGFDILGWLVGQAILGLCLLEAINYIEHYGLRRHQMPDGRYERVGPAHSWNSNSIIANLFLFHLQRHSDHHANPRRRYQALCHADEAPQLPANYPTMLLMAALPPVWRRVMDRRVLGHYDGDIHRAALSPRLQRQLLRRYARAS